MNFREKFFGKKESKTEEKVKEYVKEMGTPVQEYLNKFTDKEAVPNKEMSKEEILKAVGNIDTPPSLN